MKFNSLKRYIYEHCKSQYPTWVHKGALGRLAVNEWNYENENMGRRCRDLVSEGLLEVKYERNCALYRWLPPKEKTVEEKEAEQLQNLKMALL